MLKRKFRIFVKMMKKICENTELFSQISVIEENVSGCNYLSSSPFSLRAISSSTSETLTML